MKLLLLLALSFGLLSCRQKEAEPTTDTETETEKPKLSGEEHVKLIREKLKLEKEIDQLISSSKKESNGFDAALALVDEANLELRSLQLNHPALEDLSAKISSRTSFLQRARAKGEPGQIQAITAEITKLQSEFMNLAKEQPEIQAAEEKLKEAEVHLQKNIRMCANGFPEGQDLVKQLDEINQKLVEASK